MGLPVHDIITSEKKRGSTLTRLSINPAYLFLRDEMMEMSRLWADGEGESIYEGRNSVRVMGFHGLDFAVKRYKRLSLARRIVYTHFRSTKALRGLIYSLEYRRRGVLTPEGIAAIEVYRHGILSDAYLVTQMSPGRELFLELVMAETYDPELALEVADFLFDMHGQGVMNKDSNLRNILTSEPDGDGKRILECIDINRSIFTGKSFSRELIVKNLSRVTHRRELLMTIVERYALRAGYPVKAFFDDVIKSLNDFERNRTVRHRLKKLIFNK